ncbi:hypothetical protein TNCV_3957001 [Trichonephila clavipes]|nr:hypothetical protein TNCV_3957001 [Trichonephila clavipes]
MLRLIDLRSPSRAHITFRKPLASALSHTQQQQQQMPRSGGQSEARPPALSAQASLVLIYRPTAVGMKD